MLPKQYRLKKRTAFNATYKTGRSLHYKGITLFCGKEKKIQTPTKIGFVVSKKIHKRAVRRNRVKRLMREAVRIYIKNLENNFESKYISLIFVATTSILDKNFEEVDYRIKKLVSMIND